MNLLKKSVSVALSILMVSNFTFSHALENSVEKTEEKKGTSIFTYIAAGAGAVASAIGLYALYSLIFGENSDSSQNNSPKEDPKPASSQKSKEEEPKLVEPPKGKGQSNPNPQLEQQYDVEELKNQIVSLCIRLTGLHVSSSLERYEAIRLNLIDRLDEQFVKIDQEQGTLDLKEVQSICDDLRNQVNTLVDQLEDMGNGSNGSVATNDQGDILQQLQVILFDIRDMFRFQSDELKSKFLMENNYEHKRLLADIQRIQRRVLAQIHIMNLPNVNIQEVSNEVHSLQEDVVILTQRQDELVKQLYNENSQGSFPNRVQPQPQPQPQPAGPQIMTHADVQKIRTDEAQRFEIYSQHPELVNDCSAFGAGKPLDHRGKELNKIKNDNLRKNIRAIAWCNHYCWWSSSVLYLYYSTNFKNYIMAGNFSDVDTSNEFVYNKVMVYNDLKEIFEILDNCEGNVCYITVDNPDFVKNGVKTKMQTYLEHLKPFYNTDLVNEDIFDGKEHTPFVQLLDIPHEVLESIYILDGITYYVNIVGNNIHDHILIHLEPWQEGGQHILIGALTGYGDEFKVCDKAPSKSICEIGYCIKDI